MDKRNPGQGVSFGWLTHIKPLIFAAKCGQLDIVKFSNSVETNEEELLNHPHEYGEFYNSFCALVAHFVGLNCTTVSASDVLPASRIVAKYFLNKFESQNEEFFWQKMAITILKNLTAGIGHSKSDVACLIPRLKSASLPPSIRATVGPDRSEEEENSSPVSAAKSAAGGAKSILKSPTSATVPSSTQEAPKPQMPPASLTSIFEGLCSVAKPSLSATKMEIAKDPREEFGTEVTRYLVALGAGLILLRKCCQLEKLERFISSHAALNKEASPQFSLSKFPKSPDIFDDQSSIKRLLDEMELVESVLDLPVLEPLTEERLDLIIQIIHGCLMAALSFAFSPKEAVTDGRASTEQSSSSTEQFERGKDVWANSIANTACRVVFRALKLISFSDSSGRAAAHNLRAMLCRLLFGSLAEYFKQSSVPIKFDSSVNLLSSLSLDLLLPLIEGLKSEPSDYFSGNAASLSDAKQLSIHANVSFHQRVAFCIPLPHLFPLLLSMMGSSYEKLLEAAPLVAGMDRGGGGDSRTSEKRDYQRRLDALSDIPCIDADFVPTDPVAVDSADSEPIIGSWLEQMLSSVPALVESALREKNVPSGRTKSHSRSGDKAGLVAYSSLCSKAVNILNDFVTSVNVAPSLSISNESADKFVGILTKLPERDYSTGQRDGRVDIPLFEFAGSFICLLHNAILRGYLSEPIQNHLLMKLNIRIGAEDARNQWPLYVPISGLSVLGQILVLRLQRPSRSGSPEKQTGALDATSTVVNIWCRFLNAVKIAALRDNSVSTPVSSPPVFDDVNVEHVELLLVLFHSLRSDQKKEVILKVLETIMDVSKERSKWKNSHHLWLFSARLLNLIEYFAQFYMTYPLQLIEHVQRNIFPVQFAARGEACAKSSAEPPMMDVESSFRRRATPEEQQGCIKPLFYELVPQDDDSSALEVPVWDNEMASVLLGWPGYANFYDLIAHLSVGEWFHRSNLSTVLDVCSLYYFLKMCRRLYSRLVPSQPFLFDLAKMGPELQSLPKFFNCCHAVALICSPTFHDWAKEAMLRVGVSSHAAETMTATIRENWRKDNGSDFLMECFHGLLQLKKPQLCEILTPLAEQQPSAASAPEAGEVGTLSFVNSMLLDLAIYRLDFEVTIRSSTSHRLQSIARSVMHVARSAFVFLKCSLIDQIRSAAVAANSGYLSSAAGRDALSHLLAISNDAVLRSTEPAYFRSDEPGLRSLRAWQHANPLAVKGLEAWQRITIPDNNLSLAVWQHQATAGDETNPQMSLEKALDEVLLSHFSGLLWEKDSGACAIRSAKRLLDTCLTALTNMMRVHASLFDGDLTEELTSLIVDVSLDATAEAVGARAISSGNVGLELLKPSAENNSFSSCVEETAFQHCLSILQLHDKLEECGLNENVLLECLRCMAQLLDKSSLCESIWMNNRTIENIGSLMRSSGHSALSHAYNVCLLRFYTAFIRTAPVGQCEILLTILQTDEVRLRVSELLGKLLKEDAARSQASEMRLAVVLCCSYLYAVRDFARATLANVVSGGDSERKKLAAAIAKIAQLLLLDMLVPTNELMCAQSSSAILQADLVDFQANSGSNGVDADSNDLGVAKGYAGWASSLPFSQMFTALKHLATVGQADGHKKLIAATIGWLNGAARRIADDQRLKGPRAAAHAKETVLIDSTICLLEYLLEVCGWFSDGAANGRSEPAAVSSTTTKGPGVAKQQQLKITSSNYENHFGFRLRQVEAEPDFLDYSNVGVGDDEDSGEESETDDLHTKLCTFTVTQKDFIQQHWYHCHTCGMVDGEGVCSICAKVCHQDHDLSYSKLGSFFCDCGASAGCQALVKRAYSKKPAAASAPSAAKTTGAAVTNAAFAAVQKELASSAKIRSSPNSSAAGSAPGGMQDLDEFGVSARRPATRPSTSAVVKLSGEASSSSTHSPRPEFLKDPATYGKIREEILGQLKSIESATLTHILTLLGELLPIIMKSSAVCLGTWRRLQQALADLHKGGPVSYLMTTVDDQDGDSLVFPSYPLTSAEGALDNVRLQFAGDQGTTIRQLLTAHVVHRTALAACSHKKRQNLVVCHDKGKISILQLSNTVAKVETSDVGKSRLTLAKVTSDSVPFTVLSIIGNDFNEDFVAVAGLKECQILGITSLGTVGERISVKPSLEAGNFISKILWLPASQTELAIVTADFVQIFDFSISSHEPQFQFVVPAGKIRDATFACWESEASADGLPQLDRYLLLMSSTGHVYMQKLLQDCTLNVHGPFYVTTVLEIQSDALKQDKVSQIGNGGVSIYYSHALQLLFASYHSGLNIYMPFAKPVLQLSVVTTFDNLNRPTGAKSAAEGSGSFTRWTEIRECPGLIACSTHISAMPVLLFVRPDEQQFQELKLPSTKAKVVDLLPIRQTGLKSGEMAVSVIVLADDGSLRCFAVNPQATSTWRRPSYAQLCLPPSPQTSALTRKRKKPCGKGTLPVDFFESCQQLDEGLEFGGRDVLQIYNRQQLKSRLFTNNQYIASAKAGGFQIEVSYSNSKSNMAICGIRVELGKHQVDRAPSFIEVFGRSRPVYLNRARWYDVPFTQEEAALANNKIVISFGPSRDPDHVAIVDSILVYGKSKDLLNWPDDLDADVAGLPPSGPGQFPYAELYSSMFGGVARQSFEAEVPQAVAVDSLRTTVTNTERLVVSCFNVVENFVQLFNEAESVKEKVSPSALQVLSTPVAAGVVSASKSLLMRLLQTKDGYYHYKDRSLLEHCMRTLADLQTESDPDLYGHILLQLCASAIPRPEAFVRLVEDVCGKAAKENGQEPKQHFLGLLFGLFWKMHSSTSACKALAPVTQYGFDQLNGIVRSLVEILNAFCLADAKFASTVVRYCADLLFSKDLSVTFACKQAICSVWRSRSSRSASPVPLQAHKRDSFVAKKQTHDLQSSSFGFGNNNSHGRSDQAPPQHRHPPPPPAQPQPHHDIQQDDEEEVDVEEEEEEEEVEDDIDDHMDYLDDQENHLEAHDDQLEALFDAVQAAEGDDVQPEHLQALIAAAADIAGGAPGVNAGGGAAQIFELGDNDEAMVELAIALSLQEQRQAGEAAASAAIAFGHPEEAPPDQEQAAAIGANESMSVEGESGQSDDEEGSITATEGSTLRGRSPSEGRGGGGDGSESGGSTGIPESARNLLAEHVAGSSASADVPLATENVEKNRLHTLHLNLLDEFTKYIPLLNSHGGVHSVAFMQVILVLMADVACENNVDRATFENLLTAILAQLTLEVKADQDVCQRTPAAEAQLILLRFLSILMSKARSRSRPPTEAEIYVATATAKALVSANSMSFCHDAIVSVLAYWNAHEIEPLTNQKILQRKAEVVFDMVPFFLQQYVKEHARDVFEDFPLLITEMVLRIPYQLKKLSESYGGFSVAFSASWSTLLCEFVVNERTVPVRKQARKLLLHISGSKESYRHVRDNHTITSQLGAVRGICRAEHDDWFYHRRLYLDCAALTDMVEHLKVMHDIATSRCMHWQKYCLDQADTLEYLFALATITEDGVSSSVLSLIQLALCAPTDPGKMSSSKKASHEASAVDGSFESAGISKGNKFNLSLAKSLISLLLRRCPESLLAQFVRLFLLICNTTQHRWQAHGILFSIFKNGTPDQQKYVLSLLWSHIWPEVASHGKRAAQLVDLLGYFTLTLSPPSEANTINSTMNILAFLKTQNELLFNHPNANIYNCLSQLLDGDGYYLETNPCLVCNNPEIPFSNIKLSTAKADSRFTTSSQIIKLTGSYEISRIVLKISDIKRSKMVRQIRLSDSNKSVPSVVDLKNKPDIWSKPRKFTLTQGQTEVRMDFPLPIIACNLLIEYSEFYDTHTAVVETVQCPRCSAAVAATPGVCANCGENVYQCHKCRSINYDEKEPFLCNSCGFCKYGKYDYVLFARPCVTVDPITNEEDRKKALSNINALLEKADNTYSQLQSLRPQIESYVCGFGHYGFDSGPGSAKSVFGDLATSSQAALSGLPPGATPPAASFISQPIQEIATKYARESRAAFDELSKILQKILACRNELVKYDRNQGSTIGEMNLLPGQTSGTCYGCLVSNVEHCVLLLRGLCTSVEARKMISSRQDVFRELYGLNLRNGPSRLRKQVCELLCALTTDNLAATKLLSGLIEEKILSVLRQTAFSAVSVWCCLCSGFENTLPLFAVPTFVLFYSADLGPELDVLGATLKISDACWKPRVETVLRVFLASLDSRKSGVLEIVTLPCLKMLEYLMMPLSPAAPTTSSASASATASIKAFASVATTQAASGADSREHSKRSSKLRGRVKSSSSSQDGAKASFSRSTPEKGGDKAKDKKEAYRMRLMEKFGKRWLKACSLGSCAKGKRKVVLDSLRSDSWLEKALFSRSSVQMRRAAVSIVLQLCTGPNARTNAFLDFLTRPLDRLGEIGDVATDYLALYKALLEEDHWKWYLARKGILKQIGALLTVEIERLNRNENPVSTDLSQGFAVKAFAELLGLFLSVGVIRKRHKSSVLSPLLNAYLSLRRLLVQRTKHTDDAQATFLQLLEQLTTGTEAECREFMEICVSTLRKYPADDVRTPVFIFERLCSMIYPEEKEVGDFLIIIEKDPAQEDFLQGRMMGNPYNSNDPGMGPLMRDIKNKICRDCDLIALLEDDTGMELLVNGKIVSLDLPVSQVYRKLWSSIHPGESMLVIYRMRGLLGDATEEFISSLDAKTEGAVNEEEVYKLAGVLYECGGVDILLQRLRTITGSAQCYTFVAIALKVLEFCIKIKRNRERLIEPSTEAMTTLLGVLKILMAKGAELYQLAEKVLNVIEALLLEANTLSSEKYKEFADSFDPDGSLLSWLLGLSRTYPALLLSLGQDVRAVACASLKTALMAVLPNLALKHDVRMAILVDHFKPFLDFNRYDYSHSGDETVELESFCLLAQKILPGPHGDEFKQKFIDAGLVQEATDYLTAHCPPLFKVGVTTDAPEWKEFLSKHSLKYVLRLLTGLCTSHEATQTLVAENCIPIIHRLEQISTEEHLGSLSELLMEALRANPAIAKKIEDVRKETKAKRKKMAMDMRAQQLKELDTKTAGFKGAVDLNEETGLVCSICREGYRNQPAKALGIYTYTTRVNVDEFDLRQPKRLGYSTVTHFNAVHIDCHSTAVRVARGRDEWESGMLHNAHTRCNGLLPLWGPSVPELSFVNALTRHNSYIQECTGLAETNFASAVHDLKHLLWRFAADKSFSDESGGGGKESNVQLIPYLSFLALYVVNTTKNHAAEERSLRGFLEMPVERWIPNSYEPDGPLYFLALAATILPSQEWQRHQATFLRRTFILAQCRVVAPGGAIQTLADKTYKEFAVYKPYLNMFALVNAIYSNIFSKVASAASTEDWCKSIFEFIRRNDVALLDNCKKLLQFVENDLTPCATLEEWFDVNGLEIVDGAKFCAETLASVP